MQQIIIFQHRFIMHLMYSTVLCNTAFFVPILNMNCRRKKKYKENVVSNNIILCAAGRNSAGVQE